jgi:hypothetical protein
MSSAENPELQGLTSTGVEYDFGDAIVKVDPPDSPVRRNVYQHFLAPKTVRLATWAQIYHGTRSRS